MCIMIIHVLIYRTGYKDRVRDILFTEEEHVDLHHHDYRKVGEVFVWCICLMNG